MTPLDVQKYYNECVQRRKSKRTYEHEVISDFGGELMWDIISAIANGTCTDPIACCRMFVKCHEEAKKLGCEL